MCKAYSSNHQFSNLLSRARDNHVCEKQLSRSCSNKRQIEINTETGNVCLYTLFHTAAFYYPSSFLRLSWVDYKTRLIRGYEEKLDSKCFLRRFYVTHP